MANPDIEIISKEVLSDNWYTLYKYTFRQKSKNGLWSMVEREAYDRGNGAVVLLYNIDKKTIILTQQFRLPAYVNEHPTGLLIEACAGLLDAQDPVLCIQKEIEEETGFKIDEVREVHQIYMSPGSVTEKLHFFIATYEPYMKIFEGGGSKTEQEFIDVLELMFEDALKLVDTGTIQDGKTILLLYYLRVHGLL